MFIVWYNYRRNIKIRPLCIVRHWRYMKKKDRHKDRANWFVCVSHETDEIAHLKESCKNFKRWFYIEHQPDSEDGRPHIHVMVMYGGSCYIRTAARILGIPDNFVQFCDCYRAYSQYMIHKNSPEKIKYSASDVVTNVPGLYKAFITDVSDSDITSLFNDLHALRFGTISLDDFLEAHFVELQSMPFYQKIKIFEVLEKISVRTT